MRRIGKIALAIGTGLVALEVVLQIGALVALFTAARPGGGQGGVLCIGDSYTYGFGASSMERSYPAELGRLLPERSALVDFVVKIRRSACVVKGGRRFSFNALVVVGDRRGRVAYGYGKANEVPPAVEKAIKEGEGNVQRTRKISLRGNTIPHRVIGKYGASRVILVPAGPGTGVKAGPGVREVLQAAGITNILTKVHGSTNPLNLVKATIQGLLQLRTREEVVRLRGVAI